MTGYFALFISIILWNTWISPSKLFPVSLVLMVMAGPLLFPLRGLLKGNPYTFAWTGYLAIFYCMHGMMEAYANPAERPFAITEITCSLILYAGTIMYARTRSKEIKSEPH